MTSAKSFFFSGLFLISFHTFNYLVVFDISFFRAIRRWLSSHKLYSIILQWKGHSDALSGPFSFLSLPFLFLFLLSSLPSSSSSLSLSLFLSFFLSFSLSFSTSFSPSLLSFFLLPSIDFYKSLSNTSIIFYLSIKEEEAQTLSNF